MTGTRTARLAADLRERVALGDVGPAGALESEAALSARYGVSRVTVRRALDDLREQGLVESRRGAGWFVTGTSFHQTLALGTFRHATSAVAAAGKSARRTVVEFGYLPAPPPVAVALAVEPGTHALYSRSVRTVDGEPLDVVHEWVPPEPAAALSRAAAQDPGIWATLARQGSRIESVRQTITAGAATEDDGRLLEAGPGTPLLLVRRVAHPRDGAPLALSDHRYLAHRFSLEVEFRGWSTAASAEPPGLTDHPTVTGHTIGHTIDHTIDQEPTG